MKFLTLLKATSLKARYLSLLFVAGLLLILIALPTTHIGSKILWQLTKYCIPQLQGELSTGALFSNFTIGKVVWADTDTTIASDSLSIEWLPSELLAGDLVVEKVTAEKLNIHIASTSDSSEKKPPDTDQQLLIKAPLPIDVKQLSINGLGFESGDTQETFDSLKLSFGFSESHLTIRELSFSNPTLKAEARGFIKISGDYSAKIDAELTPKQSFKNISLTPINAQLHGQWPDYKLTATTNVDTPRGFTVEANLNSTLTLDQLTVHTLQLRTANHGSVNSTGTLQWFNHLAWQGDVYLDDLNLSLWIPKISSRLNGSVTTDFSDKVDGISLKLTPLAITGDYLGKPAQLSGALSTSNITSWSFEKLRLVIGDNTLEAQGQLNDRWQLSTKLNATDLSDLLPDLQGDLSGTANLSGHINKPIIDFQLDSKNMSYKRLQLSGIKANGQTISEDTITGKADIKINSIATRQHSLNNIQLLMNGSEADHTLKLTSSSQEFAVNLQTNGEFKDKVYLSHLNQLSLQTPIGQWKLKAPTTLAFENKVLSYQALCLESLPAILCIKAGSWSEEKNQLAFNLYDLNTEKLLPLLPGKLEWQANLNASGLMSWQKNQPLVSFDLSSSPGHISVNGHPQNYQTLNAQGSINKNRLKVSSDFSSHQLGRSQLQLTINQLSTHRDLNGRLDISQFDLQALSPFFPEVERLKGVLTAKTDISGTAEIPLVYGRVSIAEGALNLSDELPGIEKIETELLADGQSGTLQGALTINNGRLYLSGDLNWQDGYPFKGSLKIHGQDVLFFYPGYGALTLSPDILIHLAKKPKISGTVNIPSAKISVKKLPDNAVQVSDDTVVYYSNQVHSEQKKENPYTLAVSIRLGQDVNLDAYGLTTNLTGQIDVEKAVNKELEGKGIIHLKDGRYHQFGQDLVIKKGKVIFQGPLKSPYLQIDAIRNPDTIEDNVTVGINVSGIVTQPEWTVYSSPSMSRQEQLSYLLKGKSVSDPGEASLESFAIGAGIGQLGGFTSNLGEKLGVNDLALEAEGSGDDTQITIGGYVAPGLRLQYGAGVFSSIGELKARYELLPKLYLQFVTGLDQAVDIFYRFTIPSDEKREAEVKQ